MEDNREIYEKAIRKFGISLQLTIAIEEFSELTKEICKNKRGNNNIKNIIEEIADCYIMLEQIKIIFAISNEEIEKEIKKKTQKLCALLK